MAIASKDPHVVIVGGGFAGLSAAQALRKERVRITLIDRRNHHLFQPLLYQVATAALNPSDIASPIRHVLRKQANCQVLLGEAVSVDTAKRIVWLRDGQLVYDFLILATGATHSYFGHEEWERFAPGLKTVEDALEIRRRMLLAYEAAERETDPERRKQWLTFVVVGGGPTGVEMAGALAEIARLVLTSDFRHIDPSKARIILVEAVNDVLTAYAPELRRKAGARLRRMGVELRFGKPVSLIDEEGVTVGGERILSHCVIWAAGIAASPLARTLGAPLDRAGRVIVKDDLTVPGAQQVFVLGDLASAKTESGKPIPGVAQPAIQGGKHAALCIMRMMRGEPPVRFHYCDKGSLATIGRAAAVAEVGPLKTEGFFAWLLWLFIHVLYLITFRNRLAVLGGWAWSYLRSERGARLITGEVGVLIPQHAGQEENPAIEPKVRVT
ncbi:MAG TPA: NAD(P)/FAD-dependent oxidoreductase [Myxococcales bacterium]|nr:NAD(P)/FAD-dependent oxidoreductase [Myxococcales bacterium]